MTRSTYQYASSVTKKKNKLSQKEMIAKMWNNVERPRHENLVKSIISNLTFNYNETMLYLKITIFIDFTI